MAHFVQSAASGSSVVRVVGEIDLYSAGDFAAAGRRALSESDAVELDLSGVTFMDTTGITVMVQLLRWASTRGASLTLVDVPTRVHRILELTGLLPTFDIRITRELSTDAG